MNKSILMLSSLLFGGRQTGTPPVTKDNPATIQDDSENGVRRQLVQVLIRDLLRRHGIPPQWIDCQMMAVSSRTRGPGMYLRLVVRHWDERLMNHASAFQKEVLSDLKQFEPQAATWLHGVSWQLEVDDSCPYTKLPGKSYWQDVKSEVGPEPKPEPRPSRPPAQSQFEPVNASELEKLFAIRDRALSAHANHALIASGYEKTQPIPL